MSDLDVLAELFDALADDHPRTALPLLVRATGPLAAPELGMLPLEGQHPGSVLLGFRAPAGCTALGVVSTGWSVPPDRDDEVDLARNRRVGPPAATLPDRVAVRSTVLVGLDCEVAGRLSIEGADPVTSAPESGAVLDLLLRALGCPTAPPGFSTLELFASVWLSHLATGAPPGLDWEGAAARHWARQLLPRHEGELEAVAVELADELDWAALRRSVARHGWDGVCTAGAAAWFDDGAFARWVLGSYPPVVGLLAAVAAVLDPPVAERVRRAVAAWGLGDTDR